MKLYILALDGMDYDFAVNLNLKNVLQKQYGKLRVPIDKNRGCPSSAEVWASFLCAEHIKMGFKGKRNMWARNLLKSLKKRLPFISLGLAKKITGRIQGFQRLNRKTWVDNPTVEEIGVPYYSYTNEAFQFMRDFERNKKLIFYRRRQYWLFLKQTAEVISKTRDILRKGKNIDVVFSYIHFPDLFNHAWFTDKDRLKKYYHLLIISDHGFDFTKNEHSDFGFISSNKKMMFPKSIIELGKQIKKISEENMI